MSQAPDPAGPPPSAGRYQRSANGLIAAMVVTVLFVAGFLALRGLVSSDLEVGPESVDYLERVEQAQDAGVDVVYPPALPTGWIATRVTLEPGDPPSFTLNLLTDDARFVGIRQSSASLEDLLDEYVDTDVDEAGAYDAVGSVAPTWQRYTDEGGDTGYAAELAGATVLVYGSAPAAELEIVVDALTTTPTPR